MKNWTLTGHGAHVNSNAPAPFPVGADPRSDAKIEAMERRAAACCALCHPADGAHVDDASIQGLTGPTNERCPYCGARCEIRDSGLVYGVSYGLLLICCRWPACDSFVACHADGTPKGTVAGKRLRTLRRLAHEAFDPLWQGGGMTRRRAYAWLAREMRLPEVRCHIGQMDEEQCLLVMEIVERREEQRTCRAKQRATGPRSRFGRAE